MSSNINRFLTCIIFLSLFSNNSYAQDNTKKGKLAGKVVDAKSGEDIIGATVSVEGTTNGTATDLDGRYFLQLVPGTYTINVSYVSYKSKKLEGVEIKEGELTPLNITITESTQELEEVVVKGEVRKESAAGLLLQQKNSVAVSSGISADLIRKMPDRTTADVIKRVSGATIQDGKFAVVRGMQDRYNYGLLNGAPLPSSEPDRKAFSLDLIPAQVIDNMVISKTATPDMPGDFAGGLIQITTRDIPDENVRFINIGGGYHSITTFKDFYKSPQSGGADWLGADNGSRQLPGSLLPTSQVQDVNYNPFNNASQIESQTKLFNNDFTPKKNAALPNYSFQIGASQRGKIGNNDFGIIGAVTYNNANNYEPYERNTPRVGDPNTYQRTDSTQGYFYNYKRYRNTVNLGGILNFTLKVGNNNKFFFKNLITQVATDQTILREGKIYEQGFPAPFNNDKDVAYFYQSNRSYFSQFGGEHLLNEKNKMKVNYVFGYTNIFMQVPDFKRNFTRAPGFSRTEVDTATVNRNLNGIPFSPGSPNNPGRYFFDLNERSVSANYDFSFNYAEIRTNLKIGGGHQLRSREFLGRNFNFTQPDGTSSLYDPQIINGLSRDLYTSYSESNIGIQKYYQLETTAGSDKYDASSSSHAGFLMAETKVSPSIRAVYGLRVESFNQKINSVSLGLPVKKDTTWTDFLPSLNLIYALNDKTNLRAGYSRTLSRPEFREFAPLAFYDFTRNAVLVGNPTLNRARIHNIDMKYEYYPAAGQTFSINPFLKIFDSPVENTIQPSQGGLSQISYQNAKSALNVGLEIEARSNLAFINKESKIFENIVVFGNFSYIYSSVDQSNIQGLAEDVKKRPLQGQSPYVFNLGAQYTTEKDFNITLTANQYGRRIAFVGQENKFQVWEAPRFVMDFSISKTFDKKWNIKGTLGDIFAQDLIFYYDLNKNGEYNNDSDEVFEKYRRGYTASVSLGYSF